MQPVKHGPHNSITDVGGLSVGNSDDKDLKSGVTVVLCEDTAIASCHLLGGAPGTRETDLLAPECLVDRVNAICLAGGSSFGLDTCSGVQAALRQDHTGLAIADHRIPVVPGAILFDLINGGDKNWGLYPPYREMGYTATRNAGLLFDIGSSGAGTGATTAGLKGGLGTASHVLSNGVTVGALVAVNSVGATHLKDSGHFWASSFEIGNEFGGLGFPMHQLQTPVALETKFDYLRELIPSSTNQNTTIGIIATDAILSKSSAKRLAMAAHDGIARAIWPAHTPFDGDIIFSLATGRTGKVVSMEGMTEMMSAAVSTTARAIARAIYEAKPENSDLLPTWKEQYGLPETNRSKVGSEKITGSASRGGPENNVAGNRCS